MWPNVQDLTGEIVVVRGTTAEKNLHLLLKDSQSTVLDDYPRAIQYLDQMGNIALLSDNTILSGLMEQHPGRYRIIELQPTGSEKYAAAIAKGDSGLLKVVNSVIRDFNESAETALWRDKYEKITGLAIEKPLRSNEGLHLANPAQKLLQNGMKKPGSRYQKSPYPKPLQEQLCVAYRIVATWLSQSEKTFPASDTATPKRAILRGSRSTWPMPWQRGYSAVQRKFS